MKNSILFKLMSLCYLLLCVTLFSCVKTDVENLSDKEEGVEKIPISISGNILTINSISRSDNNQFEENERLGFYVMSDANKINDDRLYDNELLKYKFGTLVFENELFYPTNATKCSFLSYYPYSIEGFPQKKDSVRVSVNVDQTSKFNYKQSDFLLAVKENILPSKNNVQLDFYHKLSKLDFVIKANNGIEFNDLIVNSSISIDNIYSEAIYELTNLTFSKHTHLNSILPHGDWVADTDNNQIVGKSVILIPQNTAECYLVLLYNNSRYRCSFPKELNLESGNRYVINMSFDPRIGITQVSSNIIDWDYDEKEYDANLEESNSDKIINIAQLDFIESSVMHITKKNSDDLLGELCYEYLLNDDIDEAVIVYYPASNPQKGTLLRRLNNKSVIVGDEIEWNNDSFILSVGEKNIVTYLSVDEQGKLLTKVSSTSPDIKHTPYIIKDLRGNQSIEYPVVKIGQQYWMRENLRATCYNDGNDILKGAADSSNSKELYFQNAGNIYYNISAMNSNKIAPIGWEIPDATQWDVLKNYIKNVSTKLKSFEWEPVVGNITGFDAKPVGIFTHSDFYQLNFVGEMLVLWKRYNAPLTIKDYAIAINSKSNTIGEAKLSTYCAYSVRAVKNRN